ncbi:MAG TPA: N-acetylglutamate synthase, partial [Candidatus Aerophobetes bacterium]|nr:N-acetylglutamate synthase [Candidatus Aerophobetes bacterium]
VYFNNLLTVENGVGIQSIRQKLREVLKQNEIKIIIHLNQGNCRTTFWGCDLTEKYVKINKRYV